MGVCVVAYVPVCFSDACGRHEHLVDHMDDSVGCSYIRSGHVCIVDHDVPVCHCEGEVIPVERLCCHSIGHIRGGD